MLNITKFPDFLTALPEIELPLPGARGWLLQGEGQQVVFVEFEETVEVPEHAHDEQWELPIAGKVLLNCDGDSKEYLAGDNFFIKAGVPHSATVYAGYKAIIIFNSRDRYKKKE